MSFDTNKKVLIVGMGLIGGSYAWALSSRGYEVGGIDLDPSNVIYCMEHGWLKHGRDSIDQEYISQFDIIIFALYPHTLIEWIKNNQHCIKKNALLTDTTGVKGCFIHQLQSILRPDLEFVGAHPMAGREKSGVKYSDKDIFKNANYIVTPTEKNTSDGVNTCMELGSVLGFKTIAKLSPEKHDEMIGFLSQLTHCIAVTLMTCRDTENLEEYTGDSFRDLTRIAKINDVMWSELFLQNKKELLNQMELFEKQFGLLKEYIKNDNTEKMREMMKDSTKRRERFDIRKDNDVMNIQYKRELPTARVVREMYPISEKLKKQKQANDEEIRKVFTSESNKFILLIGPCSADREDAVLDYISRLGEIREKVKDKILIIPRIYTNKPRTTGDGYKGMLHQPDPNSSPDMLKGVISIRKLHMQALEQTGFSCADEMLYPENHRYLSDLLSYVAVGARSVEDQQHRLTASGLEIPVGMKNPTSGDISVMLNSITAAQHPHTFVYSNWEVESSGNPLAHAILRGSTDRYGKNVPNYHYEDIVHLIEAYNKIGLQNPGVIIDTNHSNSGKKWDHQPRIAKEILHSMKQSDEIKKFVKGLMIESYIEDGAQKPNGDVYGQSITDPCLGWEKTEKLILELADLL